MRTLGQQAGMERAAAPELRQAAGGWRPRFAADRYSRRVVLLKRVLPAIGLGLLLLVAAWPRLSPLLESVRAAFPAIDLRDARQLRMIKPRYAGLDRYNRPFVVTAASGRQLPNRNDLMSLEQPHAQILMRAATTVVLTAATGVYQSQAQLLDLFGDVTLTHQDGTQFVTARAHADLSANTADGNDPVAGHGPSGNIAAQGFRILNKGDTIVFTGRAHLVLKGTRPARAATAPPALPAQIVKTAAQIETAAAASPAPSRAAAVKPAHAAPATKRHATASHHLAKKPPVRKPPATRHVTREPASKQGSYNAG